MCVQTFFCECVCALDLTVLIDLKINSDTFFLTSIHIQCGQKQWSEWPDNLNSFILFDLTLVKLIFIEFYVHSFISNVERQPYLYKFSRKSQIAFQCCIKVPISKLNTTLIDERHWQFSLNFSIFICNK